MNSATATNHHPERLPFGVGLCSGCCVRCQRADLEALERLAVLAYGCWIGQDAFAACASSRAELGTFDVHRAVLNSFVVVRLIVFKPCSACAYGRAYGEGSERDRARAGAGA